VLAILGVLSNIGLGIFIYDPWRMHAKLEEHYLVVFKGLVGRDYPAAYEGMDETYRNRVPVEEFEAKLTGLLPGTEPIPPADVKFLVRESDLADTLAEQFRSLQKGEIPDTTFTMPWQIAYGEIKADLDMDVWVKRIKWGQYEAKILGITPRNREPAEPEEDPAPDQPGPEKAPPANGAEDAPKDEPK
jgi:hypothetical protein